MKERKYWQQGDVLLFIEDIDGEYKKLETNVIAFGEVTGHSHRLYGNGFTLFEDQKTKTRFLRIVKPTALKHEEHKEITLPPGDYKIGIVRETDHMSGVTRLVAD